MDGAVRRVPAIGDAGINRMINGPEGFTPDNEFILGESEVRGFFVAAGLLRPRDRRRRAGSGARWRPGSSTASPSSTCGRWTSAGSAPSTGARPTPSPGRSRSTRPTTTSTTRTRSARPVGRSASAPTYERLVELGAAFGEKSGWERPNWFEPNATRGDERLRPRGWAGRHWSPAIGAEALATRTAAGLFDESSFAKIEVAGPGATAFLQRLCANDVDRPVGTIVYTQMLNRRGGIECDLTVTRLAADRYLIVTGTAFGQPRPGLDPEAPRRPRRGGRPRPRRGPHERAGLPRAVGPARPRHPRRLHPRRRLRRGVPVPDRAPDHGRQRARPGAPGDLRRRARLGALPADRVRRWRCGTRCGTPGASTAWSPPATGRSTRSGSRRATGSGRATSRPTRRRTRPASASRSGSTRRSTSSAATRSGRRAPPVRRGGCAASSSTTRARSALGNEPVRVDGAIVGRVTSGGYGFAVERSIAYAYLPPDQAGGRDARRGRGLRGVDRASRSPPSRSTTRRARGSGRERRWRRPAGLARRRERIERAAGLGAGGAGRGRLRAGLERELGARIDRRARGLARLRPGRLRRGRRDRARATSGATSRS